MKSAGDIRVNPADNRTRDGYALRAAPAALRPLRLRIHTLRHSHHKWLDGVSVVLAEKLRRLRDTTPSPLRFSARTLRLPGTTRHRSALLGGQRRKAFEFQALG